MPDTLHRTATLRTAFSPTDFGAAENGPGSLYGLLRAIHTRFSTIRQRRAIVDGQVIEGRNIKLATGDLALLHLVGYTVDDQMSIVPRAGDEPGAALELIDAPEGSEFLDGDVMLLVSHNDVVILKSGLGERAFREYVVQLAAKLGIDSSVAFFELLKRADMNKVELIQREGIKSISMNAVASQVAADRVRRGEARERITSRAWEELKAVLGIDPDIPADAENLKVEVLFTFDKRRGTVTDQRNLEILAERLVNEEEEEGFTIKTLEGRTVRAREIILSKVVKLDAFGKSVHHEDAWSALSSFYEELNNPN